LFSSHTKGKWIERVVAREGKDKKIGKANEKRKRKKVKKSKR